MWMTKQRKSPRRKEHNYTSAGMYFVTLCIQKRLSLFGHIENDRMICNNLWKQTQMCREDIPNHYPFVELHAYICMPNHVHGLLREHIENTSIRTKDISSLRRCELWSLWSIIRGFKVGVTKYARIHDITFAWQSSYHDHIVRNQQSYDYIKIYIQTNPTKWNDDGFYEP
jgi:REP element-mobilizing transposase RayT